MLYILTSIDQVVVVDQPAVRVNNFASVSSSVGSCQIGGRKREFT